MGLSCFFVAAEPKYFADELVNFFVSISFPDGSIVLSGRGILETVAS